MGMDRYEMYIFVGNRVDVWGDLVDFFSIVEVLEVLVDGFV